MRQQCSGWSRFMKISHLYSLCTLCNTLMFRNNFKYSTHKCVRTTFSGVVGVKSCIKNNSWYPGCIAHGNRFMAKVQTKCLCGGTEFLQVKSAAAVATATTPALLVTIFIKKILAHNHKFRNFLKCTLAE